MEYWRHIYAHINPVAFHLFSLPVHWYGIMYVLALLSALYMAKWIVKKDNVDLSTEQLDRFFVYVEIGVILGARIGYIIFYDPAREYYFLHPWQIFNPFEDGKFIGIRGMSYHGALFGFLIGAYLFSRRAKVSFGKLMDVVAVAVPLGYMFGRIGNFLNKGLVGRVTDASWGIYVDGVLRYPSQLIEALLEGVVVFFIVYMYRKHKKFEGELILLYAFSYGILRSIAELFRAPDVQIGYLCCNTVTLGQVLSLSMAFISAVVWIYIKKKTSKRKS
jgi:phosphatidylglycerol---prolipoprotein diacylglyceryl transferase